MAEVKLDPDKLKNLASIATIGGLVIGGIGKLFSTAGKNKQITEEARLGLADAEYEARIRRQALEQQLQSAMRQYELTSQTIEQNQQASLGDVNRQSSRALGSVTAGAAAAGISGASVDAIRTDVTNQATIAREGINREAQTQLASAQLSLQDVQEQASIQESRINYALNRANYVYNPQNIRRLRRANRRGAGLDIAAMGVDAFGDWASLELS